MKKNGSAPTMKDVAKEAGVALGTVSKVVNGLPVGESYRKKVEDAIVKLNYQINSYAQGLKSNKTRTVAFLIPNTIDPYFAMMTYYINVSLIKRGYKMLLCTTDYDIKAEQDYVDMVRQNKVDGIIGLTYNPDLEIEGDIPFVTIDRFISTSIPCIASDNFYGGQLAAEKLADLGCKNVAFLRVGSSLTNEPNKRKAGFENGCLARNLNYTMKILEDSEPISEFDVFLDEHFKNGRFEFDGIFCVTDKIAYFVMKKLRDMGLTIPDDVQIIGFDGIDIWGQNICSTIVQPVQDIAEICVEILLQENISTKPPLVCLPVSYKSAGTTKD